MCRQALFYKLSLIGVGGNFFKCLQYMYTNSTSKIKLINKLSEAIEIELGTEQGHPLSPELFKIFINDLSAQLNSVSGLEIPHLNNVSISHLLWADDLVLLALCPVHLQNLLNILDQYVETWELEVNMSKTNIMVFNSSGKMLKEGSTFYLGKENISPKRTYCYLGMIFSLNQWRNARPCGPCYAGGAKFRKKQFPHRDSNPRRHCAVD